MSTESSEAEETIFSCCVPQQPCFFFLDKKEWQDLRKSQRGNCFQGLQWTNVIASGIRSLHPYCSFGFRRHALNSLRSQRSAPIFKCNGYCRFEDCPIAVTVEVRDEVTLKADVVFTGGDKVCHSTTELKRRRVRAVRVHQLEKPLKQSYQEAFFWTLCRKFLRW